MNLQLTLFAATLAAVAMCAPAVARASDAGVRDLPCSVRLNKLSYDDPAADDNEFIELYVQCSEPLKGLAEAGLTGIELFNGGSATCEPYRTIPLGDIARPERGFVVVCAAGSELDLDLGCDQTLADDGPLEPGWLQNGPSDGLALLGPDGLRLQGYRYGAPEGEGPGVCGAQIELPKDPGPSTGDDVAVVDCGGQFETRTLQQAPLRSVASTSAPSAPSASGNASDVPMATANGASTDSSVAQGWPLGHVEHGEPDGITRAPSASSALSSVAEAPREAEGPPELGCSVSLTGTGQRRVAGESLATRATHTPLDVAGSGAWLILLSAIALGFRRLRLS